jgi:[ribosomal protein S5]-alanine N-acetyltransferase
MSETLTLRRLEAADWAAVHTWSSRPEFCRFQAWGPNSEDETHAFVTQATAAWSQSPQTRYVYLASAQGRPIGSGEIVVQHARFRTGEIAYGLHPDVWGRGFGAALGAELLRIGFEELGFHRIQATCDPRNRGSAGVLRKLDMTYEGRLRHSMLIRDGWRDSEMFSILEEEWRARR